MKVYLVGGAVRDKLLSLPVYDRDWVVVGATPNELLVQGYQQVGKDFPVFIHPKTSEEYALARTERKSGQGYTGFTCNASPDVTLQDDLLRRDLTINAIAEDEQGRLIDPYHGQDDLKNRLLRHVSTAFRDDPLRVLRLARFAAKYAHLGFIIAPETQAMISEMAANGELNTLTAERVWKETEKALTTDSPQVYFKVLRDCGALAVLLPEIDALFGVPAPEKWHPEIDSGIHTLLTVQEAAKLTNSIAVRFAALCHDVGKGVTPKEEWPHHYRHNAEGVPIAMRLCERLKVPTDIRDFTLLAVQHHDLVHSIEQLKPSTIVNLLNTIDVWRKPERLEQLILVSEADCKGRTGWENEPYPQADYLRQAYQVATQITAKQVIAEGISGAAIKAALQEKRINALAKWKASQK